MEIWWIYPIFGSFLLSLIFTEIVRIFALRFEIVDKPNLPRKLHKKSIPLLGGLAIYVTITIFVLLVLYLTGHLTEGLMTPLHFFGYLGGGFILMVGGILDDKFDLRARYAIIFPVIASLIAVIAGIGVSKITNPFGGFFEILPLVSAILTFLWLLGMTYTTKLLDGLDGLATGISSIAALMIGVLALTKIYYQPDVALLAFVVFAAFFGFLLWNFNPAQIFLGEAGSTFLGFTIGVLAIIAGGKMATALLVIGIPILDIVFVISNRIRNKKPLFSGDRNHLHHKLIDVGLSHKQVVFLYYAVALLFGITTLFLESWQKLLALGSLFIIMLASMSVLSKKKYER